MKEITLEDHLDELCPRCGKEHESNWELEHDSFKTYTVITCDDCNYKIFKKTTILATSTD
ncbi:hypothetical protein K9L67_05485 [Candidatus Woesearchaeota archaeon]|nr:hypothetical protein [Candidatus Woesearchaeota archaeon]MCF7901651.1 hypothetical protein [Candidatus Woesearchaeota archaeon]MCF8013864.1 hypothetical protein [Candidatus Woesearchaeota archaeon]